MDEELEPKDEIDDLLDDQRFTEKLFDIYRFLDAELQKRKSTKKVTLK